VELIDLSQIIDLSINENPTNGTELANVGLSNIDSVYLVSGISGALEIDVNGKIVIIDSTIFDYETNPNLNWVFNAAESEQLTHQLILNVILVNDDDPPLISNQVFTIDENSINGAVIGTIVASDQDSPTILLTISEGNDDNTFALNDFNQLLVNDSTLLDYEKDTAFYFTVSVTDGIFTRYAGISVFLNDVEENTSPEIANQVFSIQENSAVSTLVGTVIATDAEGDALTFQITIGNTGNTFALDEASGLLTVNEPLLLDFETTPTFTLTISVSDGIETISATITVNVTDVEENTAPKIDNQLFSILENSAISTLVGTIIATDAEGDDLTFQIISGNTGNAFVLNESSGQLTVNEPSLLDYETTPIFYLTIQVSDANEASSATITVRLTDIDDGDLIDEKKINLAFSIYPNPTSGHFNIIIHDFKTDQELIIQNVFGKVIYSAPVYQSVNNINVMDWSKGVYFVIYKTNAGCYIHKLVFN
jgi:hypothetical protein